MRVLPVAAAALISTAANAQFSSEFEGVPGVYSAAALADWTLIEPVKVASPAWRPADDSGVPINEPTRCNIITSMTEADAAVVEGVMGQFTVMTGKAFESFLQDGFNQSGGGFSVANATQPIRVEADGFPGLSAQYDLLDNTTGVTVRIRFHQIYTPDAFATASCGARPDDFAERQEILSAFIDDIQFLGGARNIASILNARALAALRAPGPQLVSSDGDLAGSVKTNIVEAGIAAAR